MVDVHFVTNSDYHDGWAYHPKKELELLSEEKKLREMFYLHMIEFTGKGYGRPEGLRSIDSRRPYTRLRCKLTRNGHLELNNE